MKRLLRLLLPGLAIVVLTGCAGPTFSSLPLPGESVSGDTITFTADFDEALNLADGANIKVNGVNAGRVQEVSVHDFKARITMKVQKTAQIRQGATARLRYTTPLGELFVDVANPETGEALADGAHLSTKETDTAPTVEDALSSSSLLINGGGLNHLKVIVDEANTLLGGREGTIRSLLNRSEYFLSEFNAGKGDIDAALTAMNGAAKVLNERRGVIRQALTDVKPAAAVVQANLDEITALLVQLEKFGATANDIVIATRDRVMSIIRQVGPVLQELARVRAVFPQTLKAIIDVGAGLDKVFPNDWFGLGSHAHLVDNPLGGGLGSATGPVSPERQQAARATQETDKGLASLADTPAIDALTSLLGSSKSGDKPGLLGALLGGGR